MAVEPPFIIEPLGSHHDRAAFSCGVDALDMYLQKQAGQEMRRSVAAVFVLRPADTLETIAGYYTLSASVILPASITPELAKRYPRYRELPAVLLGRLAVAIDYRRQGLGELLLLSALERSLRLRSELGTVAMIVDAKDDRACAFYEHYDFQRFVDNPRRLYLPMPKIQKLLLE